MQISRSYKNLQNRSYFGVNLNFWSEHVTKTCNKDFLKRQVLYFKNRGFFASSACLILQLQKLFNFVPTETLLCVQFRLVIKHQIKGQRYFFLTAMTLGENFWKVYISFEINKS